ncbi:glycosyltransferase family 2 protein [Methylocaldum szegediense]|uniref:Glycosyltransferase n=1 Tax=Methylocaldum szegediense TaxID=73780 RepID=A0ABN8XAU3_9GAMM|nr:glycosyltransferase [Methylocaldum szegediense]CAI8926887.1 Glycosyltransferase [Methylocaldum szegediense]
MILVVGIPTAGRREQLTRTLLQLGRQTRLPDRVIVCPANIDDFDESVVASLPFRISVVRGNRGTCPQRNAILSACEDADAVVFFEDDLYPAPDYLEETEAMLVEDPSIVIARGHIAVDGAKGPGIEHEEALRLLDGLQESPLREEAIEDIYAAAGGCMTVRMAPVLAHGIRFDENLPLYGWLEDIDFSRSMAPYGRIVINRRQRCIHLATKRARTSGIRFGYSQIANPVYMCRKGTMSYRFALKHIAKNLTANIVRSIAPEIWVDRRGRLKGNLFALGDLLLGRIDPRNVLQLE